MRFTVHAAALPSSAVPVRCHVPYLETTNHLTYKTSLPEKSRCFWLWSHRQRQNALAHWRCRGLPSAPLSAPTILQLLTRRAASDVCLLTYLARREQTSTCTVTVTKPVYIGHVLEVIRKHERFYRATAYSLARYRPFVCHTSVCLSKTVEVRIMKFSPHGR